MGLMASCSKEELPVIKNTNNASVDLLVPVGVQEIDTTKFGLYTGKKVTKGAKSSSLTNGATLVKSP